MDVISTSRGTAYRKRPGVERRTAGYQRALEAVMADGNTVAQGGVSVDRRDEAVNCGEYAHETLARSQGPIAIRKVTKSSTES